MRGRKVAAGLGALAGLIALAASGRAHAGPAAVTDITIVGNRHVDAAAIRAHVPLSPTGAPDAAALDAALKSLYATGLFQDVRISRNGGHILVTVAENPTIARLAFDGNQKIKDDDLKRAVQSKAGGPLSRALVHDDVEHLIALYRGRGYFAARIDPKTVKAGTDRRILIFDIKEGDRLAIGRIEFAGNTAFALAQLKSVIKTGETNVLSFVTGNDTYDADRIESDCDLIRRFYRARGYADVRVRATARYRPDAKDVVVTFTIDEGRPYRLGRVAVETELKAVDAAALKPYLGTTAGDVFDADAVQKTVEDMTLGLARNGAPFAAVSARSRRLPQSSTIDLVYTVEEGKRLYVERIEIHGNSKTRDDVIRREFDFVEGDAYSRALIDRGARKLRALGYFKTVRIDAEPGSAPDRVVVAVAVEEQQTGNVAVMGGYSASTGPTINIGVSERNVLGTGDIARASLTLGQYSRGVDVAFTDPHALGPHVSLGGELFADETIASAYQSYSAVVYGARISTGMPINDQLGVTWTYSIVNQGLTLDPAMGTASLPIRQAAAAGPVWVSSVGSGVTYSTLDDPKSPTAGVRVQTGNELAGLGGAAKFARTTEDARYYHEIAGDVVGMVRAQGGYAAPWGGQSLPLLDGFFGGPQLIRGFAVNGFGPRDLTPGTTQDNVGGNVYWTTSAELQAPMPFVTPDAGLKVALFSDAGSLWAANGASASSLASLSPAQQIANSTAVRASVGASLIWASPLGAIRVDYAYPIAHQAYDVTQRLNFTAGGF